MVKEINLANLLVVNTSNYMNVTAIHLDNNSDITNALPYFIFNEYGMIGGICSLIALVLASHQILMHLYFFNEPKLQLYIVRILLMVPVRKRI